MAEAATRQALTPPAPETIALCSARFGNYEVPLESVLHFPDGLIGLPRARRFALLEPSRPEIPFRYLVCLDLPELGFLVCDPEAVFPGYAAEVVPAGGRAGAALLVIVTVPENPREMTVNLMAPLVVDGESRQGVQMVLDTGRFSTRHALLPAADATPAAAK